ncbi:MAG: hypothetical protein QM758_06830 [Armatimonas sp.]
MTYYIIAAMAGFAVALVFRKPRTWAEAGELLSLSLGGLLLLALATGYIHTFGSAHWRAWASDSHTQAGAVGVFVALGGTLWSLLRETVSDARGMNIFEAWTWIKSGGKHPHRSRKSTERKRTQGDD